MTIERTTALLRKLRDQLQSYGDQHLLKSPPQVEKAETNYALAEEIEAELVIIAAEPPATVETLQSIVLWGDQIFGPCTVERAIQRAGEEFQELLEASESDQPIEAADVIICLLRVSGVLGAIDTKMAINRGRLWRLVGDGTGYHVKGAS